MIDNKRLQLDLTRLTQTETQKSQTHATCDPACIVAGVTVH
jgi:hypothetical protein